MATPATQRDPRDNQQRNNSDSEDKNDPPRDIPPFQYQTWPTPYCLKQ